MALLFIFAVANMCIALNKKQSNNREVIFFVANSIVIFLILLWSIYLTFLDG